MAKSLRSKVKRAFRTKKRTEGVYAATDAARLNRLNAKLAGVINKQHKEGSEVDDGLETSKLDGQGNPALCATPHGDTMDLDGSEQAQTNPEASNHVSTHGPRGSRREEWRKSKGMDPVPKRKGMNRQGELAARRRAGRPSRRR
ncbi:hypothetical protein F5J12DRAFT_887002 [Pisolithus orientalis]|uniref:uncharacterized protein n=1 Tax=Pisolithus orientalis TaxID=936130 RepID=UPI00222511DD|nr:uncharacterized protein F5J12DRAFT_887002 [Pisolithus orientalis]KAI6035183.1 hypothetical protein F5J12DRAFT_887002 [Pisolithus orientalis]